MIVIGWSLLGRITIEMLDKLTHPEHAGFEAGYEDARAHGSWDAPLARRRSGPRQVHRKRVSLQQLERSPQKRSMVWPMQPAGR